jgi:hypothetical protein
MKRFWGFALVACLLLALTPVDRGTQLDTGQQEVVALVAHTSVVQSGIVVFVATNFDIAISRAIEAPAMPSTTLAFESKVTDVGALNMNAHAASDVYATRPSPHPSGGYNVLKMPHARGTAGPIALRVSAATPTTRT